MIRNANGRTRSVLLLNRGNLFVALICFLNNPHYMSNQFITLPQAKEMTQRYRDQKDAMVQPAYQHSLALSETFDAAAIQAILNQPGCVQFRAYYGLKADLNLCVIFVGVNANGEDIVGLLKGDGGDDIIVDEGVRCPPYCPTTPPL